MVSDSEILSKCWFYGAAEKRQALQAMRLANNQLKKVLIDRLQKERKRLRKASDAGGINAAKARQVLKIIKWLERD